MVEPGKSNLKLGLSDYLAAERTLLAWIRTGLAMMGFGFVVARFGLFLQEVQIIQHAPTVQSYGLSLWFGVALIAMGVAVNVASAWRHVQLIRGRNGGEEQHVRPSMQAVAIALILAFVGLGMAIYLVSVRHPA
jgi:putative membrane protein